MKSDSFDDDILRRELAFRLDNYLTQIGIPRRYLSGHCSNGKILPEYSLSLAGETLKLTYLKAKDKGKRRVYTNRGCKATRNDVFISYIRKKDVRKWVNQSRKDQGLCDVDSAVIMTMLGDRWAITRGLPVNKINNLTSLESHLLATEKSVSKSNRPPEGNDQVNGVVWVLREAYLKSLPRDSVFKNKIVCTVKRINN